MESINDFRPQLVGQILDANAEQENEDDKAEIETPDTNELPDDFVESNQKEKVYFKPIVVDSEEDMYAMARKLSEEQMVVFGKLIDYCKRVVVFKNSGLIDLNPQRLIIHGSGGCGKSFLINCATKWAQKILKQPGDHPLKPKILILGPTGMAANLIGKI